LGRKVFVTSDISIDESLITVAEHNPLAALIWPWILTALDDWGRAEAKSKMLKAKVFPCNDMITAESIGTALRLYHDVGLVKLYEVSGKPYMSVPHDKWFKYQTHIRKEKRNVDESKYPAPPITLDHAELREESRENEPSPSPSLTPTPSVNNNNNSHEEIETVVNESEESVSKTAQTVNELSKIVSRAEDDRSMAIGTRAVDWAQEKWGRPISPGEAEGIVAWCDEFSTRGSPDPDAVVIEALKQCDNASVRNKFYLSTVLTDWREAGVLTVDHVLARDAERKKAHKRNKDPGDKPPELTRTGKYDAFYL